MILLNVNIPVLLFIGIIAGVAVISFWFGTVFGGSWDNPTQQDIEEAAYLKDWRRKHDGASVIDLDESLRDSKRYAWRADKAN